MPASDHLPPEIKAQMNQTISVLKESSIDGFGKKSYGARATYGSFVVERVSRIINAEGVEVRSSAEFYVDSTDIEVNDLIVWKAENRHIIALETWRDGDNNIWGQVAYIT